MVKVYGASDDLVEIENSKYADDEIGCYNGDVRISFKDGTIIFVSYPKKEGAIWQIDVMQKGTAAQVLTECHNENAKIYSDIFEIDSEILSHEVLDHKVGK